MNSQVTSRISDIAQQITEAFREQQQHKTDCIHAGRQSVLKAIETGALLCKAKKLVGHGHWEKWFADNIADQAGFSVETAKRYMALSKRSGMTDLKTVEGLQSAYIACGIIAETKPALKAIGMAEVDIVEQAFLGTTKRIKSTWGFLTEANPQSWPEERRSALKSELTPMVELYNQL